MLIDFFYSLRKAQLPVSVSEYLTLLKSIEQGVVGPVSRAADDEGQAAQSEPQGYSIDDFYFLSRMTLIKDEKNYDKFDKAFAAYFKGVEYIGEWMTRVPPDWLSKTLEREFTPEQIAALKSMDWDELMKTLQKRLEEQKGKARRGQ